MCRLVERTKCPALSQLNMLNFDIGRLMHSPQLCGLRRQPVCAQSTHHWGCDCTASSRWSTIGSHVAFWHLRLSKTCSHGHASTPGWRCLSRRTSCGTSPSDNRWSSTVHLCLRTWPEACDHFDDVRAKMSGRRFE